MKFSILIFVALATTATASVVEVASPVPALAPGLQARTCVVSQCPCNKKVKGRFCGHQATNHFCIQGHVFECHGSTGYTCDHGIKESCVRCGELKCNDAPSGVTSPTGK